MSKFLPFISIINVINPEIITNCNELHGPGNGHTCTCTDNNVCQFICNNFNCEDSILNCAPNSVCSLECTGTTNVCAGVVINGNGAVSLDVNVRTQNSFERGTINCPVNEDCSLLCEGLNSCEPFTVNATLSKSLWLNANAQECCTDMNVYCPNGNTIGPYGINTQPCRVNAIIRSMIGMVIYATEGLNDVVIDCTYVTGCDDLTSRANLVCGGGSCILNTVTGTCDTNEDKTCENYRLSSSTSEPTIETLAPSQMPTNIPSKTPTISTIFPSDMPTTIPSDAPTRSPTLSPTESPSMNPSTNAPTAQPSETPSLMTNFPTQNPTFSGNPSKSPTIKTVIVYIMIHTRILKMLQL